MTVQGRVQENKYSEQQQVETLEMENAVNQMENAVKNSTNTLDQLKGEMEGMEGRAHEVLHPDTKKGENEQTWPRCLKDAN